MPYVKSKVAQREESEQNQIKSGHTIQQLTKGLTRAINKVNDDTATEIRAVIEDLVRIETELIESQQAEIDMQALANELNHAAKFDSVPFNDLVRERTPIIINNIEQATMQDLVVILSALGLRISRAMGGSR